jgi:hypothetical protein
MAEKEKGRVCLRNLRQKKKDHKDERGEEDYGGFRSKTAVA